MRLTVSEKQEIIHMVARSEIGINRTLRGIRINKSTFTISITPIAKMVLTDYFQSKGHQTGNGIDIPQEQKNLVVKLALDYPDLSSRELAYKWPMNNKYSYHNQAFIEL